MNRSVNRLDTWHLEECVRCEHKSLMGEATSGERRGSASALHSGLLCAPTQAESGKTLLGRSSMLKLKLKSMVARHDPSLRRFVSHW